MLKLGSACRNNRDTALCREHGPALVVAKHQLARTSVLPGSGTSSHKRVRGNFKTTGFKKNEGCEKEGNTYEPMIL